MFITAKIHNNSLGRVLAYETLEEAIEKAKEMAENQLLRHLTKQEEEELRDNLELFHESDDDNHYSFSVGIAE